MLRRRDLHGARRIDKRIRNLYNEYNIYKIIWILLREMNQA